MTLRPKRTRLPGDNPLLRRAFEQAYELPEHELERRYNIVHYQVNLNHNYREWLRGKGIDPGTGKMTSDGLSFFRSLVEQQNEKHHRGHAARGISHRHVPDVRHRPGA